MRQPLESIRWGWFRPLAMLIAAPGASLATAQASPPEVRQIVTFQFLPGRAAEAIQIYQSQLRPIYQDITPLLRFRGYQESESPEPLDLIVVSSYQGMEGMDRANEALRKPSPTGRSAFELYGTLSAMTQQHHDQFVEIIASLSDTATGSAGLTIFQYIRLAPGVSARFERLLLQIRPVERDQHLTQWSETGRMLVSDGWDYLRIIGVGSLGQWQHYITRLRSTPLGRALEPMIAARKTIIVRGVPPLAVR